MLKALDKDFILFIAYCCMYNHSLFPEEARVKFEEEEKIRKAREKEAEAERKKLENAVSYTFGF